MSEQNLTSTPSVVVSEDTQQNSVVRLLFDDHGVRGEIVHLHEPVQKLLECVRAYPPCVKGLLLELAAAAVLIAATLKANGTVTVQIQCGKGPKALNFAFINIDKDLNFYGNVLSDEIKFTEATFRELVGQGGIMVISAFPEGGTRYQGIVSLDKDTMAEALEDYFKESEQLATSFLIQSDVATGYAGGMMLQIVPNIENNLESLQHLTTLAATLQPQELFELSLHESLRRLFWNDQVRVFDPETVTYRCICSKERIFRVLAALSNDELSDMIAENKGIDMSCQSCGKVYHVTVDELKDLLTAKQQSAAQAEGKQPDSTQASKPETQPEAKGPTIEA